MTEAFKKLESEIDAELAQWSDALNVRPPDETVENAKTATRITLNEALLADTPTPSETTIQRVRSRVREELSAGQRRRWFLSPPAIGAWAAAALIAISFGLIDYNRSAVPEEPSLDDAVINRFLAVNEPLMSSPALTSSISSELDVLEESISTWGSAWSELDELLESLETETDDQSRAGNESANQIASIRVPLTGVM